MPRKKRQDSQRAPRKERYLSIRTVRRSDPDIEKLGRALIELAMAQAEAEAEAENGSAADATTPAERSSKAAVGGDADDS